MSTVRVRVTAAVPAAARDTCEALVQPYLISPNAPGVYTFGVPLVPFSGPSDATPTHYGCATAVPQDGDLDAALPMLAAAVPGCIYQTDIPLRGPGAWNTQTHWHGWLSANGLKVRSVPV